MRVLHHHPFDPFSRAARIALAEKRLECELRELRPWRPDETAYDLNPTGSPPILVDDAMEAGGASIVICGADVIAEYLEERYPAPALLPTNPAGRAEARRVARWFEIKFNAEVGANLLFERVEKRLRGLGAPDLARIKTGLANVRWHMDYVSYLAERRHWLAGDRFTVADVTAAAHLSCVDYLGDAPWTSFPAAKEWYARVKSRPSMRAVLKDRMAGLRPPAHYDDPDF